MRKTGLARPPFTVLSCRAALRPAICFPAQIESRFIAMPIIRLALVSALLCSGLAPEALAQGGAIQLKLAGPMMWVKMDSVSSWVLIPGSAMEVFKKAGEAYKAMKIPTNLADTAAGQFGNSGFLQTGSLAGRRMSSWIRCGEGMTGPNADTWRVAIAILSSVERVSKDTTRLRTLVVASARNMAGNSSAPIQCSTSGQLEEAINLKVKSLAGVPPDGG